MELRVNSEKIGLVALTAFGLEAVVSRELKQLGYDDHTITDGRVAFSADRSAICRANLWLRSAERIAIKLGSFPANDFGELFDGVKALSWADWLPENAAFPVQGKSKRSKLHSVPDCQSIVKKAIVESLKHTYSSQWFAENGPKYSVEVSLVNDEATLLIDTTGPGLHKRGYRKLMGKAPLKETLAAALVQLSYWNRDRPFIDPFCGTGTIPIEAAMIARNLAPGRNREFAAESWPVVPIELWKQAREEAADVERRDSYETLIGTDADDEVLSLARYHARQAGVDADIHFQQKSFADLTTKREYGCLITNPPYGERSGELEEALAIYHSMSDIFRLLETWSIYVLTSHSQFEQIVGRQAGRRRKLYNGRIACTYYQFPGPRPPKKPVSNAEHSVD